MSCTSCDFVQVITCTKIMYKYLYDVIIQVITCTTFTVHVITCTNCCVKIISCTGEYNLIC